MGDAVISEIGFLC